MTAHPSLNEDATAEHALRYLAHADRIVSSFAIHHVSDARKRSLYAEVHAALKPGGVFCNLEHVQPGSASLHARFLRTHGHRCRRRSAPPALACAGFPGTVDPIRFGKEWTVTRREGGRQDIETAAL